MLILYVEPMKHFRPLICSATKHVLPTFSLTTMLRVCTKSAPSTTGAKKVQKTCHIIHSDMHSRELVFHPLENALAVEARPGDHSQLYPFDYFQSNGPVISAML